MDPATAIIVTLHLRAQRQKWICSNSSDFPLNHFRNRDKLVRNNEREHEPKTVRPHKWGSLKTSKNYMYTDMIQKLVIHLQKHCNTGGSSMFLQIEDC
jgi:hypothetical protein